MNAKKCLIIEDEPQYQHLLEEYISRLPFFASPEVCSTAESALLLLSKNSFDVIFLDIELPGISGIELLQSFTERYPVIITSSHIGFAVESFDLNVIDYLVKPYSFARFTRAVNRAFLVDKPPAEQSNEIFLKVGRKLQLFKFSEIEYIEADGPYSKVFQKSKFVLVNDNISVIQDRLPKHLFIRIHKSFIINLTFLTAYDYRTIWLNEVKIPIGETYRKSFQGTIDDRS